MPDVYQADKTTFPLSFALKTAEKGSASGSLTTSETETRKAGISLYLITPRATPPDNPAPAAAFPAPAFLFLADIPPGLSGIYGYFPHRRRLHDHAHSHRSACCNTAFD